MKQHEKFEAEIVNGKRGKILKRHEKLEVQKVNAMQEILKRYMSRNSMHFMLRL